MLFDLAAGRQRAALLRDSLDVTAQLDLLGQQRLAGTAILGAFVRKANATGAREFGGGLQGGIAHDMTSLGKWI